MGTVYSIIVCAALAAALAVVIAVLDELLWPRRAYQIQEFSGPFYLLYLIDQDRKYGKIDDRVASALRILVMRRRQTKLRRLLGSNSVPRLLAAIIDRGSKELEGFETEVVQGALEWAKRYQSMQNAK